VFFSRFPNYDFGMIFVDRSSFPTPSALSSARAESAREKVRRLLSSSSSEHLAQLRITFEPEIYLSVRQDLIHLFKGKCAYCESRIDMSGSGDIEHFRPKQGARSRTAERDQLHYAWLAYEWDNLLIACIDCNRVRSYNGGRAGKADNFPLEGPRAPLLADVHLCRDVEKPLLLDPCFDRPEEHLSFQSDGLCRALSPRGSATIEILGLNLREALVEARASAWYDATELSRLLMLEISSERPIGQTLSRLRSKVDGSEAYTAVYRAAFQDSWDRLRKHGIEIELGADGLPVIFDQPAVEEAIIQGVLDEEPSRPPAPVPIVTSQPPSRFSGKEELPTYARERVKRIEIRNFKTLDALDLEMPEDTSADDRRAGALVILGENATGKSSILQAIALAMLGTAQIDKLGLKGQDFLRRDTEWRLSSAQPAAEIRIYFEKPGVVQELTIDPRTGEFRGTREPATVLLGYGPRRFFAEGKGTRRPRAPSARVKTLFDPTAIITNPSPWLKYCSRPNYNESIAALRKLLALPDEAFVERPAPGHEREGEIMFQLDGNASPLDRLSDGYKTTVAMGVDVMREMLRYWRYLETARGIVLIDEVETHLHPRWKMRIMQRLRSALPQVQFIVTTHDPLSLRGMFDGEVRVLRRELSPGSGASRVELVEDLPNVQGLSIEQLLTSDLFGLFTTEDPVIEAELIRYTALAAKSDRSEEENFELVGHRAKVARQLRLGDTPAQQLVQDAVGQFLQHTRGVGRSDRGRASQTAIDYVVGLWSSAENEDQ
jgi:uncharacterized protein (TIGR02646 family)